MSATFPLICHPSNALPEHAAVEAQVLPTADGLQFVYRLSPASSLEIPQPTLSRAVDGLWQQTCCEAFVAAPGSADYREFNFSPSGCWAAYRFHAYRDRDLDWTPAAAPAVHTVLHTDRNCLVLVAHVPASLLPDSPQIDLSLTAVIEERSGQKTYWALAHQAPEPDFHCRDSFTLAFNRP